MTQDDHPVTITPRADPPAAPPAWGMGDSGRPGRVVDVHGEQRGGGAPRLVGVRVSNIDGAALIIGLLVWTAIMLVFFAPTH